LFDEYLPFWKRHGVDHERGASSALSTTTRACRSLVGRRISSSPTAETPMVGGFPNSMPTAYAAAAADAEALDIAIE